MLVAGGTGILFIEVVRLLDRMHNIHPWAWARNKAAQRWDQLMRRLGRRKGVTQYLFPESVVHATDSTSPSLFTRPGKNADPAEWYRYLEDLLAAERADREALARALQGQVDALGEQLEDLAGDSGRAGRTARGGRREPDRGGCARMGGVGGGDDPPRNAAAGGRLLGGLVRVPTILIQSVGFRCQRGGEEAVREFANPASPVAASTGPPCAKAIQRQNDPNCSAQNVVGSGVNHSISGALRSSAGQG
jgi:hypothetical protein